MAAKRQVYAITVRAGGHDHQYLAACDEGAYIIHPFEVRLRPGNSYYIAVEYRDNYTEIIELEASPEMRYLDLVLGKGGNYSVAIVTGEPGQ